MNILLYKPLCYDLNKSAKDINFCPDEDKIKSAINSFFLERTPTQFSWLNTIKREYKMRRVCASYPPIYWNLSNPKKEVFKKLEVMSVC